MTAVDGLRAVRSRTAAWSWTGWATALLVIVMIVGGGMVVRNLTAGQATPGGTTVPTSADLESALGVRMSQVAVVGDGGLVQLNFVVLDAEKARQFIADTSHPPVITSEDRDGGTSRVSVMRQGHNMRPGQTYYLVYQNTAGAIVSGDEVTITASGLRLENVPVL